MGMLKGILFDYGHTLVYFPHYERTHFTAANNVKKVLQDLGVSKDVYMIKKVIESVAQRADVVIIMEEEFTEIFNILKVKSYSQDDLQKAILTFWKPYVQNVRGRKGVKELFKHLSRRELKLGIVANIWSGGINPVLERLEIKNFFDVTIASIDVGFKKPSPKIFRLARAQNPKTVGRSNQ